MQAIRSYSDQELITAIKDERTTDQAIGFIYREYYGYLESCVVVNGGQASDAEDVIQEALIAFVEIARQNRFRGESSVKSFLYTLTRNLWVSEIRKRTSSGRRNLVFESAKDPVEQGAIQYLAYKEDQKLILDLFAQLGDKCRQILLLVYYENLPMSEILEQVEGYQNEQVLRNKKHKCMKTLEKMISENPDIALQLKNALKNG
jgi:RNA polymerase sigma factor (sigma-70 family)